ncbi:MAG TPA: phosphoglycerate kinase, partial [Caulobacteraceae bacterium]
MSFRTLAGVPLRGQRALVRVDFNAPMADGAITDDTRLRAAMPTIARLKDGGAKVILLAHFGRPNGKPAPELSLRLIAAPLSKLLGAPVAFADDCIGQSASQAVAGM